MTGLGIDAELSEAAHRGRPEASAPAIAKAIADEPRTYGLKVLHLSGLTWYQDTLTTEDARGAHTLNGRVCTLWYIGERGSGAQ